MLFRRYWRDSPKPSHHSTEHLSVSRLAQPSRKRCSCRSAAPADGHRACARWRCLRHLAWRGGRRSPLVPPRRAASCASRSSSTLFRPFGCSPPRSAGTAGPLLPPTPAIPAPGAVFW